MFCSREEEEKRILTNIRHELNNNGWIFRLAEMQNMQKHLCCCVIISISALEPQGGNGSNGWKEVEPHMR